MQALVAGDRFSSEALLREGGQSVQISGDIPVVANATPDPVEGPGAAGDGCTNTGQGATLSEHLGQGFVDRFGDGVDVRGSGNQRR